MASLEQSQSDHPLPAPAQIALALVVLKSKPAEACVEDYLTQLRDCIVEGCASAKRPTSQYPDGAEYWKKAYEKAEEERKALLDKLHKHEKQQTVASLFSSPTARSPLTKDGKRKREDTPAAQANSRSKRRTNLSNTPQSPAIDDVSSGYGEALLFGEVSGGATKLLQSFFALRMHMRRQPTDLFAVQASASRLCHTISAIVQGVGSITKPDKDRNDGHSIVWPAIRRTYNTLSEAVELLHARSQNASSAKTLISELAKILTGLLKCLQSIAMRGQPRSCGLRTRTHSRDSENQIPGLVNLIAGMMTDLDLTEAAHQELFDGLLCTFFEYLGSNLSMAVFSEPMTQGLPQPVGLLQPRGLSAGLDDHTQVDLSTTLKVAPYLIAILRKMKPHMDGRGDVETNGCAGAVLKKMQNTLLRALFGDQDQAFGESLERPAEVESVYYTDDLMADEGQDATSEWFIGEVWNNVGWKVLTKHIN